MADNTRSSRKRSRDPLSDMANLPPSSRRRPGPRPANEGQENISLDRALFSGARIHPISRPPPSSSVTRPRSSSLVTRIRPSSPVTRPHPSASVTRPRPPLTINITRESLRPRPLPKRRFFGDDAPVIAKRRNLRR